MRCDVLPWVFTVFTTPPPRQCVCRWILAAEARIQKTSPRVGQKNTIFHHKNWKWRCTLDLMSMPCSILYTPFSDRPSSLFPWRPRFVDANRKDAERRRKEVTKMPRGFMGSWVHGFMALDPYRYDSIRIRFSIFRDAHSLIAAFWCPKGRLLTHPCQRNL